RVDPPVTYRLCREYLLIIPRKHAQLDDLIIDDRDLVPTVSVDLKKQSLQRALDEFIEQTGINVVVDNRVADKAEIPLLTATLNDIPIDTAVHKLADMAGLKPVVLDDAIYVTSKANADEMQKEQDKRRQQRQEKAKATSPKPPE